MNQELEPSSNAEEPSAAREVNSELAKSIKEAIAIPSPHKEEYWKLTEIGHDQMKDKRILGVFKRRALTEEEAKELKKAILQYPGDNKVKVERLRKKYPCNGLLFMYSAICSYGMLLNSSNKNDALMGFKFATKEAATALLNDQISLYNMEMFFKIYFTYLDRYKRFQVTIYEKMLQDPRLKHNKREFLNAIQIVEQLFSEKVSIQKIINQLKKRIKSSMYASTIDFKLITEVAHHMVNGNMTEKCRFGAASETIAYVHAIAAAFARIPVLFPVVEKILSLLPEANQAFLLRKISIKSIYNFVKFKMAAAEGEKEIMAGIGKTILKENTFAVKKLGNQSLYQPYETDPFFNLAFLAELSHGLYSDADFRNIVDSAIEGMETVIKQDMSKNHIFTENATKLSHKLSLFKSP